MTTETTMPPATTAEAKDGGGVVLQRLVSPPCGSIVCGDSLSVMRSWEAESVDLIITSPPYNCRKPYGVCSDEIAWPEYYAWMEQVIAECYRLLKLGGTLAVNVPGVIRWQSQHAHAHTWSDYDPEYPTKRDGVDVKGKGRCEPIGMRIWQMMFEQDKHMREPVVWPKGSEGNAIATSYQMGCDSDPHIRPAHEWILLGSKGRWYHRGGTGRRGPEAMPWLDETKDVWFMSPVSSDDHPAPFPLELPRRLIRLFGHADDTVILDPFAGSGTTCLAAKEMHKQYVGIELNPQFAAFARETLSQEWMRLEG